MARYGYHSYEVGGMPMGHLPRRSPMGMDPNYRGGRYRGERFREAPDSAPYGRYRADHGRELGGYGGARGGATGAGRLRTAPPARPSGPVAPPLPRSTEQLRGRGGGRDTPWRGMDRGYDRDFDPRRRGGYRAQGGDPGRGSGPRRGPGGPPGGRGDGGGRLDPSRPLRYDGGLNRYGGYRGGGFSDGFIGSGR
jgi:translation initiation factor IF-2